MIVLILDLDWMFDKSDIPNINCMKLSSFHKQNKDTVYFVGDMFELKMYYDRLYIFCNSDSTPTINAKILNDKKTILFGKRFELCGAKKLGSVIMGCRPDYLLYDITEEKSSSYNKANFITFFTDCGEKILKRQPWKNTKKGVKRTIVTDTLLWQQDAAEIVKCLEELQEEKNIVFFNSVSLKVLATNEEVRQKFITLHFSKGTKFKWKNDIGSDEHSALLISNFLKELKRYTKSNVGSVPLRINIEGESVQDSIVRLIKAISVFKQNKIKCFLPQMTDTEPKIYAWMRQWCEKNPEHSFIDEMVFFVAVKSGKKWFEIINNPQYWGDTKVKFFIKMLLEQPYIDILPQMSIKWDNSSNDFTMIDFDIIKKHAPSLI